MGQSNLSTETLWENYSREKSIELKNELVMRYVPRVKSIVMRMMPTYQGYCNYDDMLSCGVLGLMDAIDKYDISRDVKFEYYATMRIKGEIIDNIRKQDWAPSSLRRKIKEISNAYTELENKLLREPTDSEVAEHLNMDDKELQKTLGKAQMFNIIHFEEMVSDDFSSEVSIQDTNVSLEKEIENKEMIEILGGFIDKLSEKERLVVTFYYYEEMTLKEIAGVLGVSESRASQIHSKAIMKLRTKMEIVYK